MSNKRFKSLSGEIKLMMLDPGHFHAPLVQKNMYSQVAPQVHVYAPPGPELKDYLDRIEGYNHRPDSPTRWEETVYSGEDYLNKMLQDKPGNVVVLAGNNRRKTEYIKKCVEAGLHVFSDKPMCINPQGFEMLRAAFNEAKRQGVLLYDIMTERFEITTLLQKELMHVPEVFGQLQAGSLDHPAITKESVHHFFKIVSGKPVQRPAWFVDVEQQGEGIVDVSTHLVDLVMWECFPETAIHLSDVKMLKARRWDTLIERDQYAKMTGLSDFANYLKNRVNSRGQFPSYCNGEMIYAVKGIHAKVSVIWNFEAPAGGGDTHYSIVRGSHAHIVIEQGAKQKYQPELYCEGKNPGELGEALKRALNRLQSKYPGLGIEREEDRWHIIIPARYRVGHEAHFGQVTENYLRYLKSGSLPPWEIPNMLAKYFTTTQALQLAMKEG
jgi:predicted dehydrogenase